MAFKDQQNLLKVEILFYESNSYFIELILIWILQVSKLLLGESTYVTMHMLCMSTYVTMHMLCM